MFRKKYNFLVFPKAPVAGRAKSYSIPILYPWIGLVLIVAVITGLLAFSINIYIKYNQLTDQDPELTRLRRKAAMQEMQLHSFAEQIRILQEEMTGLRQFDRNIRALTNDTRLAQVAAQGLGGSETETSRPRSTLEAGPGDMIRQMHRDLDRLLAEASVLETVQHELSRVLLDTKSILASTPEVWPLRGIITSYFGYRKSPFGSKQELHRGLDIAAPVGTPILAPADGFVINMEKNSGYGNILTINHGYGLVTRYAHILESFVKPGQRVRRGEKIAAVGATGRVTGAHLHYEVLLNGIHINPMRYLAAREK